MLRIHIKLCVETSFTNIDSIILYMIILYTILLRSIVYRVAITSGDRVIIPSDNVVITG